MEGTIYITKEAILKRAQEAIGIPFKDIDKTGRISSGKGAIGQVVEESWFGYTINSDQEPDFPEAGVELKVTPYYKNDRGISAKERLVCNIINYMEEYKKTFLSSSFWHKCNTMLLMSYEHIKDKPKDDYHIDRAILFSFPEEDLIIIEQDWKKIIDKIKAGLAHEISEGDTLYLAACTKGANSSSVREQPFSSILAKQRAYSLKASYMTQVLRKYVFGDVESEKVVRDYKKLEHLTLEDFIKKKLQPYYGKTQDELKDLFDVHTNAKNLNELLLAKMLGIKGKISKTDEFQKAGIVPKTIRVQKNGFLKESMSFPTFDFIELSKETVWEESTLYNMLAPTKYLFVIFRENNDGQYVFSNVMFWNIPNKDLEKVKLVWQETRDIINAGVVLEEKETKIHNNFPKLIRSGVAHVRPHARNAQDKLPLPDGRMMTKQCFWLNNYYIAQQIQKKESQEQ